MLNMLTSLTKAVVGAAVEVPVAVVSDVVRSPAILMDGAPSNTVKAIERVVENTQNATDPQR